MNSDQPNPADEAPKSDRISILIDEISDEFVDRLRSGESADWQQLVDAHPDLAPILAERLKFVDAVYRATHSPSFGGPGNQTAADDNGDARFVNPGGPDQPQKTTSGFFGRDATLRINCPHCGNVVQLVTDRVKEVVCESCGSSVIFDPEVTRSDIGRVPQEIGRFKIKRLLGQGGFGSVYLAFDPNLERDVAVKVPRHGYFTSPEEEQRFFREAQSAARLQHPNIVRVHEVSQVHDTPYIVSEFINGLTLGDLASGGTLTFQETAELMVQICNAVDYAHQNGIVHRDLKPSNILVDQNRNTYVSDFGMARRDDAEIVVSVEGVILGTPAYMSPEQASGSLHGVNAISDVYSLGVVLYKMLCRELPFSGTKRMLLYQVIHDEPKRPRRLNDNIPVDLETITLKSMAKLQKDRYQSAGAVAEELQRWLRGESILARPVSRFTNFYRLCSRHPAVTSLCTTIAGLILAGLVFGWFTAQKESRLRAKAENSAQVATDKMNESNQRLYQIYQLNGQNSLKANELGHAGYWFSRALELQDNRVTRTQLGLIFDQMPRLKGVFDAGSQIESLRYSKDGSRLAAGTKDGRVIVFDTSLQTKIFEQKKGGGPFLYQLEIFMNGEKLAFLSSRNSVQVWDVDSQTMDKEIDHSDIINAIAVDSTGSLLATGALDSKVQIWDANQESLKTLPKFTSQIDSLKFVPNSDLLVVSTLDVDALIDDSTKPVQLFVLNHETNEQVYSSQHKYPLNLDITKDGMNLLTTENKKFVRSWDVKTGKQFGKTIEPGNKISQAYFGQDSKRIFLVENDNKIRGWNIEDGVQISGDIEFPFDPMTIVPDPDRHLVAVSDRNGTARFYSRESGTEVSSRIKNRATVPSIEFHPNTREVAIEGLDGVIHIWDLAGSFPNYLDLRHADKVRNALFSPNGNQCVTVGLRGQAFIWDTVTGRQIGKLDHDGDIFECALSPNGQLVATCGADKTARVWDITTGKAVGNPFEHQSPCYELSFSPDGNFLVTGCEDGTVSCWSVSAIVGRKTNLLFAVSHNDLVRRVIFDSTGDLIASASFDGNVRCWNSKTGIALFGPFKHQGRVYDCDFFPDGKRIVTSDDTGDVFVWNIDDPNKFLKFTCGQTACDVNAIDNEQFVTSDSSGASVIWAKNGNGGFEKRAQFRQHVLPSCFYTQLDSKSELAVSAGGWVGRNDDHRIGAPLMGSAFVWDSNTGLPLGPPLSHRAPVRRVSFNSDATKIITASEDALARIWKIEPTDMPVIDMNRLAKLYNQTDENTNEQVIPMSPQKQLAEFEYLSKQYRDYFATDNGEVEKWQRQFENKLSED